MKGTREVEAIVAEDIESRLMGFLEKGELEPITKIKLLKHISPASRCRLALNGIIPSIRIGSRIMTHPILVAEALRASIIRPAENKANATPKVPVRAAERLAEIAAAKERNAKRGLTSGYKRDQ